MDPIRKRIDEREIIVLTRMRSVDKTTLYRVIFDGLKSDNKAFLDMVYINQKLY
jgi:AAA+ ATPase superfamily predicted ATPase